MRTVLIVVVAALLASSSARLGEDRPVSSWQHGRMLDRGRYLVHHVAMCVQCHSPRGADGVLAEDRLLRGGEIPFETLLEGNPRVLRAPRLAGLPGYSEEAAVRLLTEGITRDGGAPQAPMPPFRMQHGDAEAVVAYLMSLE